MRVFGQNSILSFTPTFTPKKVFRYPSPLTGTLDYPILYGMPRYRLKYGSVREFEAQTPGEVVPFIADSHFVGGEDERDFMRRLAISMSQWNRGSYCYTNRDKLAQSMMKEGLLECVD